MNKYELDQAAKQLEDSVSPYQLARRVVEAEEREAALTAHVKHMEGALWRLSTYPSACDEGDYRNAQNLIGLSSEKILHMRDLINRAEALEEAYKQTNDAAAQDYLHDEAAALRQQVEAINDQP